MKKTQWTVLFKNIWATKVSFVSIVMFVALGIAVFLGVKWNQPAFINAADDYYKEKCLYNFTLSFPYGITDADIEKLNALDEVSLTEGGYTADGLTWVGKDCAVLAILSESKTMNYSTATEGEMPRAANEIAIERGMADALKLAPGDMLSIRSQRGGKNCLVGTDFVITGIVEHPAYISISTAYARGGTTIGDGEQDYYVVVADTAFNKEAYEDSYSDVYVRCDGLRAFNSFSDAYLDKAEAIAEKISTLGGELGAARYAAVLEKYQTELDDADAKIRDAEGEIADGESKLTAAEAELAELEKKIANGEIELADAEKKLADAQKAIEEAKKQIAAGESKIASGNSTLAAAEAQIAAAESQIGAGEAALAAANQKYQAGKEEYDSYAVQLAAAKTQIQTACQETNALLEELHTVFLDTPQGFQDAVNAKFAEYGFDPWTFRLSDDPAELKTQLEEVQRAYTAFLSSPNERIKTLEALQKQMEDYNAQYDGEPDSPEKQAALAALHEALAWEDLDDDDLAVAAEKLQAELARVRNGSGSLLSMLNEKIEILTSLQNQIADYRAQYEDAPDSPEKQAALEALHQALAAQEQDDPDLAVAAEEIRWQLSMYTSMKEMLLDADTSLRGYSAKISEYLAAEAKLNDASEQLQAAAKAIADGTALLESAKATLAEKKAEVAAGRQQLYNAQKQLESGKLALAGNIIQWEAGKTKLANGRATLLEGKNQLLDGKGTLAKKRLDLENGLAELAANKEKLAAAKSDFADFPVYEKWIVRTRSDNFSYTIAQSFSKSGEKVCYSLSLLFVFVGVMVCYTAISRMVQEQRVMTGVQKSLGFRRGEITALYLSYAALAVLLGAVLGAALGFFTIEPIMNHSFAPNFLMGEFAPVFRFGDLLAMTAAEMLMIGFSAWIACRKLLAKRAVTLLNGNEESIGRTHFYERFRFWDKLSLYTQTTINNLANDKTRVIATLVGVAGCTALIVMAMSVQMSLINTPRKHFSQVSLYDRRLVSDDEVPGGMDALADLLTQEDVAYTEVLQKNIGVEDAAGETTAATLIVPSDPAALPAYLCLADRTSGEQAPLPAEGVLLSEVYAKRNGLREGDSITLVDMMGQKYTARIAHITKYYLASVQVVMSQACYEKLMGTPAQSNTFLLNVNGADAQALDANLKEVPGYFTMSNDTARWTSVFETYQSSVSLMVGISLSLSALMAILVILNLNIVLIDEKAKELIVMRINGYSVAAAKRYIYRDNIVLTLLGTGIGVAAGVGLGMLVIASMITKSSNMILDVSPLSCIVGTVTSIAFSLITNLIALRRVGKLRVSDLNK